MFSEIPSPVNKVQVCAAHPVWYNKKIKDLEEPV